MDDPTSPKTDWSDAVSAASRHVRDRTAAIEEAAERQKPKSRAPILAAVGVIFVAVLGWNVYVLAQPPELPGPAEEALHLRYFVGDAVNLIEDFRAEEGRLPTRADLGDLLDAEIRYDAGEGGYVVGLEGEQVSVEYDGSVPLDAWVAAGTDAGGG